MSTQLHDPVSMDLTDSRRSLLVVWQNPNTRRFIRVGRVDALDGDRYAFRYLPDAHAEPGFYPLVEYPDLNQGYVTDGLPAFFANRVLSSHRSTFARYLEWLGLAAADEHEIPLEFLARTGGGRATDTIHIVDFPVVAEDAFTSRFFVSGLRYSDGIEETLTGLAPGDELRLESEPDSPKNSDALLILSINGAKVGYVPDWLCSDIGELICDGWDVGVTIERVNPDAPPHIQLLVRLDARPR